MTQNELTAFFEQRHGQKWYGAAAKETGYSFSHLWRIANDDRKVSRKLEIAIRNLKPRKAKDPT